MGGSSALKLKMLCAQLRGRIVQTLKKNFQKKSKKTPPPILHGRRKNIVKKKIREKPAIQKAANIFRFSAPRQFQWLFLLIQSFPRTEVIRGAVFTLSSIFGEIKKGSRTARDLSCTVWQLKKQSLHRQKARELNFPFPLLKYFF